MNLDYKLNYKMKNKKKLIRKGQGGIAATYSLPEINIYPNNRFGDIARTQGLQRARNWRKVREGTTAGINQVGSAINSTAQTVSSFLPVVSDVQDAKDFYDSYRNKDYVGMGLATAGFIPFIGGFASNANRIRKGASNLVRSTAARATLVRKPSSKEMSSFSKKNVLEDEFVRGDTFTSTPVQPYKIEVDIVDGQPVKRNVPTELPSWLNNYRFTIDDIEHYGNPNGRFTRNPNTGKSERVSTAWMDGNALRSEALDNDIIISKSTGYRPEVLIHSDHNVTGKNVSDVAHFDKNGKFSPGKLPSNDNKSEYIWWELNHPFYDKNHLSRLKDLRIIQVPANSVKSKSAYDTFGFGMNTRLTPSINLEELNPTILESNELTGFWNRVKLPVKSSSNKTKTLDLSKYFIKK